MDTISDGAYRLLVCDAHPTLCALAAIRTCGKQTPIKPRVELADERDAEEGDAKE